MQYLLKKWRWGLLPAALAAIVVAFLALTSYTTPRASATNPPDANGWKVMGTYVEFPAGQNKANAFKLIRFTCKNPGKCLAKGERVRLGGQPGVDWIPVAGTDAKLDTPLLTKMAGFVFLRKAGAGDACATLPDPSPFAAGSGYVGPCNGPAATGSQSGVVDIMVTNAVKDNDAYHCISNVAQDAGTNLIKSLAICFDNTGVLALISPSGGEPPSGTPVGEGPDNCTPGGTGTCIGPPPPPPYTQGNAAQGAGSYNPGTDTSVTTTCFADAGASLNIISVATIGPGTDPDHPADGAVAQIAKYGKQVSNVQTYLHDSIAECTTLTPAVDADVLPLTHVNFYPVGNPLCHTIGAPGPCEVAPFRTGHSMTDYDADGCTDTQELTLVIIIAKCGHDPWNPFDTAVNSTGAIDILAIATRADVGGGPPGYAPGFYYGCNGDNQLDGTSGSTWVGVKIRVNCYIDNPFITINVHKAKGSATLGASNCGGVIANKFCGDGFAGSMPPGCNPKAIAPDNCGAHLPDGAGAGAHCAALPCDSSVWQFSNIPPAGKVTELTGVLDSNTNSVIVEGCFQDDPLGTDATPMNPLGNVIVQAVYNLHTGNGFALLWNFQTRANCKANPVVKVGAPGVLPIFVVKQAPGAKGAVNRDSDGDGCPDKKELGSSQTTGGMRDPSNRWDFFNPEKVNTPTTQTVADILKVVGQFGKNQGNVLYNVATDRTGIIGGNPWNLGPPDGQQTVADILASVKQFGHSCTP